MSVGVLELLEKFDRLPAEDRRQAAHEILLRAADMDTPILGDESLVRAADEVFLALDRDEDEDA